MVSIVFLVLTHRSHVLILNKRRDVLIDCRWISHQLGGTSNLSLQVLRAHSPGPGGKLIGSVSLMPPDSEVLGMLLESGKLPDWKKGKAGDYELGYYLHPDFQGKGIVKAGVRALLDWAKAEGVERVKVKVLEENVASRRIVESMGGWEKVEGGEDWIDWPENKGGVKGETKRILEWRWTGWSGNY
jgi:RimJ/RimL family protein N-acetyltransferase